MYSTILTQHLDLQRMPLAVQKLQPQLVAAALGEALPRWGVGRRHAPASAPGESTPTHRHRETQPHHNWPVPWEPHTAPPHHGTGQMKPQFLLFSCLHSKHSIMSLETVRLNKTSGLSYGGESEPGSGISPEAAVVSGHLPTRLPLFPADSPPPEGLLHLLANSHQVPLPLQPPGPLQHIPGSGRAVSSKASIFLSFLHHASLQCTMSLKSTMTSSQSQPLNSALISSKITPED